MRLNYIDNVDCLEGIKEIPDASGDAIVTDPPYFLSMGHSGSFGVKSGSGPESVQLQSNRAFNDLAICAPFYRGLFGEFSRVLKREGCFYWFTDWRGYAFYFPLLIETLPVRNLIVWDKKSGPGSFYSYAHELIVFGSGRSKMPGGSGSNVWRINAFSSGAASTDGPKVHPTQKPLELIEKCIRDSTERGGAVLDTFMGSGTTAVACIRTGRNYIGFELDARYYEIAQQRICEAELDAILEAETSEAPAASGDA